MVDDLGAEERFDAPPLMVAAGIASSLTVPIGPEDDLFGVLSVHSQRQRAFSADDTSFAQGVANVLAAAVRRARDDDALREGEASLQLVLAGTGTAAWWWEVGENRIRWSEGVAALHGLPEDGAPVEYEQLTALLHPDDRAALDDAVRRSVEDGVGYELVFRIIRPDGAVRWLETEAHAERDDAGRTVRLMGIVRDVTDRRLAEQRERLLADATELLGRGGDLQEALGELTTLVHGRRGRPLRRGARVGESVATARAVEVVAGARAEPQREPDRVLPLRGRAGELGTLSLSLAGGKRRDDDADEAFALELARRVAAAIEDARLREAERRALGVAEHEAARRARLQDLAAALATATTREEVGAAFVHEAAVALGADAAFLVVRDGAQLVTAAAEGVPAEIVARYMRFEETASAGTGEAVALLDPVFARSRDELAAGHPGMASEVADAGLEALAVLPLTTGERSVGFGGVAFRGPHEFADADRTLLVAIGRQTVQALERARFLAEAQAAQVTAEARRSALERLLALTPTFHADTVSGTAEAICRSAMDLLGADAASVRAVEDDRLRTLARVPEAETEPLAAAAGALPEVRAVVERGRPAFARDDEGAALHLPLAHGDAATAFVTAWWTSPREAPDEAELALAARFADQAAIALERAERLEAQRRAEALAAALERLLDPPGIEEQATLAATAREVCTVARETFGCETAGLWERTETGFMLLARLPPMESLPPGLEIPLSALPDDGRHMLVTRPWFEPDMPARFASHPHLVAGHRQPLRAARPVPARPRHGPRPDAGLGRGDRGARPRHVRAGAAPRRPRLRRAGAGAPHGGAARGGPAARAPGGEPDAGRVRGHAGERGRAALPGGRAAARDRRRLRRRARPGRRAHRHHRRRRLRPRSRRGGHGRDAPRGLARARAGRLAARRPAAGPAGAARRGAADAGDVRHGGAGRARRRRPRDRPLQRRSSAAPDARRAGRPRARARDLRRPAGRPAAGRGRALARPARPGGVRAALQRRPHRGALTPRTRRRASASPACARSWSATRRSRRSRRGTCSTRRWRTRPRSTAPSCRTTSRCC